MGGDHHPFGLQIILNALTAATHRGDPVALLNIDPALAKLREQIKTGVLQGRIRALLLDNPTGCAWLSARMPTWPSANGGRSRPARPHPSGPERE